MASDDLDLTTTPGYRGDGQIILNSILIAMSTIFVMMRLYARIFMVKRPGIDDIMAVMAYGFLVALSVMEIKLVQFGSGTKIRYVGEGRLFNFFNALTTQSLLYFWCVCFMRLHIAAFLPNLHQDKRFIWLVWSVAAVTLVSTLIFFFIKITSCKPIDALWLPPFMTEGLCMSGDATDAMMNAHSVIGILIDIALVALPVWVIVKKMMFSARKFRVILIFSVGAFVIATGIVRFVLIRVTPFNIDATYAMSTIGIWTDLEGHVGLWCGCFPALQPVLRWFLTSIGASRLLSSYKQTAYGQSNKPDGGSKGWNKSNAIPLSSGPRRTHNDDSSQKGIFGDDMELNDVENVAAKQDVIVKKSQVDVVYSQRGDSESSDGQAIDEAWGHNGRLSRTG